MLPSHRDWRALGFSRWRRSAGGSSSSFIGAATSLSSCLPQVADEKHSRIELMEHSDPVMALLWQVCRERGSPASPQYQSRIKNLTYVTCLGKDIAAKLPNWPRGRARPKQLKQLFDAWQQRPIGLNRYARIPSRPPPCRAALGKPEDILPHSLGSKAGILETVRW